MLSEVAPVLDQVNELDCPTPIEFGLAVNEEITGLVDVDEGVVADTGVDGADVRPAAS